MSLLIGSITSHKKDYCFVEWISAIQSAAVHAEIILGYHPELYISDNSGHKNNYFRKLSQYAKVGNTLLQPSPQQTLMESHNQLRKYFLEETNCEWLLHIESDVIVPYNIIPNLLVHEERIVCAPYLYGQGENAHFLLELTDEPISDGKNVVQLAINDLPTELAFMDGSLKPIFSAGLGCCLIHRSVLEKIHFRIEPGKTNFPDSFFFTDCQKHNINVFADTSVICKHRQQNWFTNPDYYVSQN